MSRRRNKQTEEEYLASFEESTEEAPAEAKPKQAAGKNKELSKPDATVDESEVKKTAPQPGKSGAKKTDPSKTVAKEEVSAPEESPSGAGDDEDDDEGATKDATKKKKKKKPAEEPKKKKGSMPKKLQEALAKAKEEEERLRREEEERMRREEEEAEAQRLREEEEERKRQEIKAAKKLKAKEREKQQAERAQQQKAAQIRAQLAAQGFTVPSGAEGESVAEKKKKPVYGRKKGSGKASDAQPDTADQASVDADAVEPSASPPPDEMSASEPAAGSEQDAPDDWEAVDSWEAAVDKPVELAPAPTPAPAVEVASPAPPPVRNGSPAPAPSKPQSAGAKKTKGGEAKAAPAAVTPAQSDAPKETTGETGAGESDEAAAGGEEALRSPIVCILGHVDTGKTKLQDYIRRTKVQEGEAGGITQQIGATFIPVEALREQTKALAKDAAQLKVPGLLVIDTPGHESFTNLRSRGSSLCDIAVLVVDIMHGLEPQTIESLNLLKMRRTPFVVALNKIDRLYGWRSQQSSPLQPALERQERPVRNEFEKRVNETIAALAAQGLNANLYYKFKSMKDYRTVVSIVPTSAVTGEGIPDLLFLLVQLTQRLMAERLLYMSSLQCTVLEVKVIEGLGTTLDVILVNGVLHEGDTIVLCGLGGPIVTHIRALLTPQPLREMRVKGTYVHHKQIKAAMGVKICATDLEKAVAGSSLLIAGPDDDVEDLKREVMKDLANMEAKMSSDGRGVYVQASTLGSLEALLEFLKQMKIPVAAINIGPVNKKDVVRSSIMLEKAPEYAVILAFDVKVNKEAAEHAEELGVKIFTADIIYHLFDQFTKYITDLKAARKSEAAAEAVFPCRLRIYPEYVFNKRDPIVLGVEVIEGTLRLRTPICVPSKEFCDLGRITSIEKDHKPLEVAKTGTSVAIKIENDQGQEQLKAFGRHFDEKDELVSRISRQSIDILKESFREELSKDDVRLLAKLKQTFQIM